MLPIMAFSLSYYIFAFINYIKTFHKIIDELWLDRSGNEVRIVFRNRVYRKFRNNNGEEIMCNSALISPIFTWPILKSIIINKFCYSHPFSRRGTYK